MSGIFTFLIVSITGFIESIGYWGIGICMGIESCNIPLPSEIILPFGGYLVSLGRMSFWDAVMAGTIGGTIGSIISYYLGRFAMDSRMLFWVSDRKKEFLIKWFNRYGEVTVFFSRLLPMIRTFISLPAGAAKMNLTRFIVYSFAGSLIWSILLTYLGFTMGQHWTLLEKYFHEMDIIIIVVLLGGLFYYLKFYRKRNS